MADIEVTDNLDNPVGDIKIDLSKPSSLVRYLKSEALHFAVIPDFLNLRNQTLTKAAPKPIEGETKVQHKFQLGSTQPEIDVTPDFQMKVRVNATPGTSLFEDDPFQSPAKVPANTGYVSAGFQGGLDLGVSGSEGKMSFGFDSNSTVDVDYWKAFPLGTDEPTFGIALGQTLSSFVIPADLFDLAGLAVNDVATVSGNGSLKVCGGVKFTASPNPLASAALPLGAGTIAVQAGVTAGLNASFTLSGSYQIRLRRKDADTLELSFFKEKETALKADLSLSGGVTAGVGDTDFIAALLGAISTDPVGDKKLLADLTPDEAKTFADAVKSGMDHSLQASLDLALSSSTDDQAAFQYEIKPAALTDAGKQAAQKALSGDLSQLTSLENTMQGNVLAPGITMLNSVLKQTRDQGVTLKINLLGIVNFVTVSELIRNSEIVTDDVTGDVTIKETVKSTSISAISDPLLRREALRKAIFDSVLTTTSYLAGKAVSLPSLSCQQTHFEMKANTNHQVFGDYLRWFGALNLLRSDERTSLLNNFSDGGTSTCVMRTSFSDAESAAMFLDQKGNPRRKDDYADIGRQALRALLDPKNQAIDKYRAQILSDAVWKSAFSTGPVPALADLVGLSQSDPNVRYLIGDVFLITQWAGAMAETGAQVQKVRAVVEACSGANLADNNDFKQKRDQLQQKLAAVVKDSQMRFDEPWGMVCLFWSGGSPETAYGKLAVEKLIVERGTRTASLAA